MAEPRQHRRHRRLQGVPKPVDHGPGVSAPEPSPTRPALRLYRLPWGSIASTVALIAADWLAVVVCLATAWVVRGFVAPALFPSLGRLYPFGRYLIHLYLLLPWTLALAQERLYTRRRLFW